MNIDTLARNVISRNDIFADIINYFLFNGDDCIKPSDLNEIDTSLKTTIKNNNIQRFRDVYKEVVMKTDSKTDYLLIGIENQSKVDNRMLLRCIEYNIMSYYKQMDDIENQNKNVKIKLKPVITFVLYLGTKKWNGPKTLYEMLDLEFPEIKKIITNPKLHLISPMEIDFNNFNKFKSEIRTILKYIKYSNDKKELENVIYSDEKFKNMSKDSVKLLNAVTKSQIIINEEDGEINMCKAINDIRLEGKNEGKVEAEAEIIKKLYNTMSIKEISNALNMSEEKVKEILNS